MGKEIIKIIKYIYKSILDIIYPFENKCIICGEENFLGICAYCKSKINKAKSNDQVLVYGYYGGVLKELILAFKYEKNFTAADVIIKLLLEIIYSEKVSADIICYVPMSKRSQKKRGFNQCEIIAKNLGDELNIPVSNCIKKVKNTKEQKTLSKEERLKNVIDAFDISDKKSISGKDIILIDDVITTGATLKECEKILRKYGANKIIILTIAKSNI